MLRAFSKAPMQDILNVEEAFGDLQDPRSRTPAHDLTEMLVVALCAILGGADNWFAISVWGEAKLDWLRVSVQARHLEGR